MRFVYPWFLLLLSLIPFVALLWLWLFRRSQNALARFVAPALQGKLLPPNGRTSFYLQAGLALAGLTLLLLAVARPQWGRQDVAMVTKGRNVVIALDVSRSMLAEDVSPNRLERAKTDLLDLVSALDGDRAALVAFRKKGMLICPLTSDYGFLRQCLDGVSPDSAPRGETDLGDAIRVALDALNPALDEYSAIILISDGGDLRGDALEGAKKAAERGIPIFTVGIGDTAGATIPDPSGKGLQQYQGKSVKTSLEEKTLSSIAQVSKGRYLALGTAGTADTTLGSIYRNFLRQISAKEQKEKLENRYQERYQLFLIPAIFLLLTAGWFSRGRLRGTLRRAVAVSSVFLACSGAAQTNEPPKTVVVPPGREGARVAQGYLNDGEFTKAAEAFLSALRGAETEEAEDYRFNAAYAYYMASNKVEAAKQLRPLLYSKKNGAKAGEFLGKILIEEAASHPLEANPQAAVKPDGEENQTPEQKRLSELEEAAGAFQKALRAHPRDERTNRNFTRAVSPLTEARTNAHIAEVLKANQGATPDQLTGRMLAEQREIQKEASSALTNADAAVRISLSEALAKRQSANADLWIPLKAQVMQQVTNQQQQAQVLQIVEGTRASMKGTAKALQDVSPDAIPFSGESIQPVYTLWRATALAPAIIDEDILRQTNAIHSLRLPYLDDAISQAEAKSLTEQFIKVFPKWAEAYQQQAAQNTNQPPFTAEDAAKIGELAQEVLTLQTPKSDTAEVLDDAKRSAYDKLMEIRKLLPKDPKQQQQQQNQQQQNQQQPQQEQQQNQQQEQQQEQKQDRQQNQQDEPKDVKEILRRALEREKEHEEEKKERMRKLPLAPDARDW